MDWCSALPVNELKRLLLDSAVLTTGQHTGYSDRPARSQTKYKTKYNTHEVSPCWYFINLNQNSLLGTLS